MEPRAEKTLLRTVGFGGAYAFLILVALIALGPFLWMFSTALKSTQEAALFPPHWLPPHLEWSNFATAMGRGNFGRFFANSLVYALGRTVLNLLFCSLAGYAFARLKFPGRDKLFFVLLGLIMIPSQVQVIPLFVIIRHVPLAGGNDLLGNGGSGWINTFYGLILPGAVTPFGIFLMRQFFRTLPMELEDAARLDGASPFTIYARLILPLSGPALATLGILTFQNAWNDFIWPLIISNTDATRTIQLGLQVFQDQNNTEWGLLMAATVISVAPLIVLFIAAQRYFVRSFALSGLKG